MVMERVQKALISMCKILQSSIVVHAHLLHPVQACNLTSQLAQKLISLLVVSCKGKKLNTESTISVTTTRAVSTHECNCLANCRPPNVHISVHCCLILYGRSKKLLFMPIASGTAGAHRDHPFVASFTQQPEIQCLVFRGQIVSSDLP